MATEAARRVAAALSDVMIQWEAGVKKSDSPAIWGFAREALRIAREGRR